MTRNIPRTTLGATLGALYAALALAGAAAGAAAQPPAPSPNATASRLCAQTMDGARYPGVRARMQARGAGRDAAAAFARGCLLMGEGRFDKAGDEFERAAGAEPSSAVYHFELGQSYGARALRANPFKQAMLARKIRSEFERAVALDPDFLDPHEGLATYFLMAPGIVGGSADRARAEAAEVRRRNAYRGGLVATQIALRQKDAAGAARELEALIRAYPDSAAPYVALATGYQQRKMWPEAWATVERLARARPDAPVADYALGRLAAESGQQRDRGASALARYLQTTPSPGDPPLANAHLRLGTIYEQQGKKEAARGEFDAALRLDPKLAGAREALDRTR